MKIYILRVSTYFKVSVLRSRLRCSISAIISRGPLAVYGGYLWLSSGIFHRHRPASRRLVLPFRNVLLGLSIIVG